MKYEEFIQLPILDDEQIEYLEMIKEDFENFNYNKDTYFCSTIANFKEVENKEILNRIENGDFDYQSDSNSKYIYTDDGVYRYSNHWNNSIASCSWFLDNKEVGELKLGFCSWNDFVPNNFYLVIYSNDIDLIKKYIKSFEFNEFYFFGRCLNYYKYFIKDNFGTGIEIENKKIYNFSKDNFIII